MATRLLQGLINRPDQTELVTKAMERALLYYHTLEDWDAQKAVLNKLTPNMVDCIDGKLTIDLGGLSPRFHKLKNPSKSTIKVAGVTFTRASCLGDCKFTLMGCTITLPMDCACVSRCFSMESCIEYSSIPTYRVTCTEVTGSWIYDSYAPLLEQYAYQYARSVLDNTPFRWDTNLDIEILRGEL